MPLLSHILISGMTSKDFRKSKQQGLPSESELKILKTQDGSLSLYSNYFKESFHSATGALKEANEKFFIPAQLERFLITKKISFLDVCVGLGYNSGSFLEYLLPRKIDINWWGLEIDKKPLEIALKNDIFRSNWSPEVINFFESLITRAQWENKFGTGNILWGDARAKLSEIPTNITFDLILLDAFSPPKCPQLWSDEFLNSLARRLSPHGRLITYSRAASIRASLRRAGLYIRNLTPLKKSNTKWSAGTIAFKKNQLKASNTQNIYETLSPMEEDHLNTLAAIPYRDPTAKGSIKEIHETRKKEQQQSSMKTTASWKDFWFSKIG